MNSVCLVLADRGPIDSLLREVGRHIQDVNRTLGTAYGRADMSDEPESTLYRWTDLSGREHGEIRLVDDTGFGARYLEIVVPSAQERLAILTVLRAGLPVRSADELLADAETQYGKDPATIARLAVASKGRFNRRVFDLVVRALSDAAAETRRQALMAINILQWSEFKTAVVEALARETEPDCRRGLEYLAGTLSDREA